jgi:2-polyprenyl-3-methyl-5-hydroxy-6-metoxy-1,4-benzoquinol methylase/glycosyltransferase involved in cell wall biosynthesis
MSIEWTGERYIPWMEGAQIHYEHIHRYAFASQFVKGKKVLDLACGEGYGSHMLSKEAEHVVGIDLDENAVKHARNKYLAQNLEFIQGSILEIPIYGKEEFDVIVCFEGIEHVEEHEQLLSEVKRLLNKDGLFIVSSPNKKTYSDDPGVANTFHKKELYFYEFKNLLRKYFADFIFLGQKVYGTSNIWPLSPYKPSDYKEFVIQKSDKEFYFSEIAKKNPLYFIAIASDRELGHENYTGSYLTDASNILIEELEKNVTTLTGTLQAKNTQVNELSNTLQAKDAQVNELSSTLQAKNTQVNELSNTLQVKDAQVNELSNTLQAKDAQVNELSNTLQAKDAQVNELSNTLQVKDAQVNELSNTLQAKDAQVNELSNTLQAKDAQVNELTSTLQSVRQSIVWKTLMRYQKVIDTLLPSETWRRHCYDIGFIGIRTIANEGWGSFWWKTKYYIRQINPLNKRKIRIEKINIPKKELSEIEIIDTKISIVIPTKNAGNEFEYILNKIKNQKGIKELELVVIDSGSIDETPAISRKYGAKLYQIKPEEFGHGKTRNLGAEKASGEFILFATQDAMFASKYLVYNMVKALQRDEEIAAVTCRQIPRSDADLMASFQVWNHYNKFLDINEDKIVSARDLNIAPLEKRKLANLSDSCCCIRRSLFLKYLFRVDFAEDLDLGIRLLKDEYKLAYLYDNAIIHSHNRAPSYFFKASYTDSKIVSQIIGSEPFCWDIRDINVFYVSVKKLYEKVIWAVNNIDKGNQNEPKNLFPVFKALLNSDTFIKETGESTLDKLFSEIEVIINHTGNIQADESIYKFLFNGYIGTLDAFNEYVSNCASISPVKQDVSSTLYKLFSNSSGAALGNYILFLYKEKLSDNKLEELDKLLLRSV